MDARSLYRDLNAAINLWDPAGAARVDELRRPTLNPGETYRDLLSDRSAYEEFDPDSYFGAKGFGLSLIHI